MAPASSALAQEDPSGIASALAKPVIILGYPFALVHELFSSEAANARASRQWDDKRQGLYWAARPPVPVRGLYVRQVSFQGAFRDTLGYLAIPFVEMDSASAGWMLATFTDPDGAARETQQHRYVRVAIAEQGDSRCRLHGRDDPWVAGRPFPARRCLAVEFVDQLASDVELRLDASRLQDRHLEWQLVDRASQEVKVSLPFWPRPPASNVSDGNVAQYKYAVWGAMDALPMALRQLSPPPPAKDSQGIPMTLRWVMAHHDPGTPKTSKSIHAALGDVHPARLIKMSAGAVPWATQVDQAYDSRLGLVVDDRYALLPTKDLVIDPTRDHHPAYFVLGAALHSVWIKDQRITVTQFGDDALPAWTLAIELDKAPELALCTPEDLQRCSSSINVVSASSDAAVLEVRVRGGRGWDAAYTVNVPASWLLP